MTRADGPVPPTTPMRGVCASIGLEGVAGGTRGPRRRTGLDLAAAREGAAERDLVGVLEVAADGQAAREARHA